MSTDSSNYSFLAVVYMCHCWSSIYLCKIRQLADKHADLRTHPSIPDHGRAARRHVRLHTLNEPPTAQAVWQRGWGLSRQDVIARIAITAFLL